MRITTHGTARLALLVAFGLCQIPASGLILAPDQCNQEQDQWCWAATSQSVLDFYGTKLTQTQIAAYGTEGANDWNWTYGSSSGPTRRGVDLILSNFGGISSSPSATALTQSETQNEIDAKGQPIVIRWAWDSGGGHILVLHGLVGDTAYLMDPWNGPTITSFSWVNRGGSHTWTHTLKLTTSPALLGTAPAGQDFGAVALGAHVDRVFTITNSGPGMLVGSLSVTAPFAVAGSSTYRLAANQAAPITIRYAPSSPGQHGGSAVFTGGGGAACQLTGRCAEVRLTGLSFTHGQFSFCLNGPTNNLFVVQVSSNLVDWVPFLTNTIPPSGSMLTTNGVSPGLSQQFFRAVLQ